MRILLVGAFAYPHRQGSQVYFQEQAIALRAAGAHVDLLTYAIGSRPSPADPDRWRALDGFDHRKAPAWTAPTSLASGPGWRKPLADLALVMTLRDAIASKMLQKKPYDAIMTHNAEACLIGLLAGLARHRSRIPLIYCVHTLLENELSSYLQHTENKDFYIHFASIEASRDRLRQVMTRGLDRSGMSLDRFLARRVDGFIALTQSSDRVMTKYSTAPGCLIPPPIPDPLRGDRTLESMGAAARHGLEYKGFYLYSGNLDAYQELELLGRANQLRGTGGPKIVVASHDPSVLESVGLRRAGMTLRLVESETEMLSLLAAARASLVPRRAEGGFPIKLANSLAVGTPPISFLEREWGLSDGENARIAGADHSARSFATAIADLDRSAELAIRLGKGARALYEANHRPRLAAERTLELIERIRRTKS